MIAGWTHERIAAEAGAAYAEYLSRREEDVRRYFCEHVGLVSHRSPLMARDAVSALPPGYAWLAARIPPEERHRWWLSGKSSQMLALALLGVAEAVDPTLRWIADLTGADLGRATARFEYALEPHLLAEHPRTTTVDYAVTGSRAVICLEAKWTEAGMGACSCGTTQPGVGRCAARVIAREHYWSAARELGIQPGADGACGTGLAYQAVRLIAAADALNAANGGTGSAHVVLAFDAENPMFAGHGDWPGWASVMANATHPRVTVIAVPWQQLVSTLPLDPGTRAWAREKFTLGRLDESVA